MDRKKLEKYGNELTITGIVVGNGNESEIIMFPEGGDVVSKMDIDKVPVIYPDQQTVLDVFNQMDTLEITGIEKAVLRKSQRNIEQGISWQVFKRDNYTCRYCGKDDVPMTVDHIVRWENLGDSVPDNLTCACRKCNKTRGGMEYPDWLESDYYKKVSRNLTTAQLLENERVWAKAQKVPLRKRQRSR